MIRGIAFDLEGTVINTDEAHHEAHLRVCRDLGLNLTLDEAISKIRHFIGGPDEVIAEEILSLTGKIEGETDPIRKILEKDAEYYDTLLSTMKIGPRPGFLKAFGWFRKNNLRTSIGSLTADEKAYFLLNGSGLSAVFDPEMIVLKSHVKNLKPAPDVFFETAFRMEIRPSEQLVFEDSPRGVQAARRAGSRAIGMPVYNKPKVIMELLEAGAERVFLDWREMNILALIENINAL